MTAERPIEEQIGEMKRDWNERARTDSKWFISCVKLNQSEEEFDRTGLEHVRGFVTAELPLLIGDRDPHELRVLEIGCGIGRMTKHLADIFGEVYGTDVSGEMIVQARERLSDRGNIRLFETNGRDFAGLPDRHFDFIFSAYVFQHIASRSTVFENIRDAFRLLRPGAVFKFLVSTVTNPEFLAMPKDTWTGTSVFEEDIRNLARDIGAQLVALTGLGTQYTWTVLRRPNSSDGTVCRGTEAVLLEAGRSDDLRAKEVLAGESAGILVGGLERDLVDANNVLVEFGELRIRPFYVGPTLGWPAGSLQVIFAVPRAHAGGEVSVALRLPDGALTEERVLRILAAPPRRPRVDLVTNAADGSMELFARGPRSRIRVHAAGLDECSGSDQMTVVIGGKQVAPESVRFIPANANWLVMVDIPEGMDPGTYELTLWCDGIGSAPVEVELRQPNEN